MGGGGGEQDFLSVVVDFLSTTSSLISPLWRDSLACRNRTIDVETVSVTAGYGDNVRGQTKWLDEGIPGGLEPVIFV